jgi:predicted ATPase
MINRTSESALLAEMWQQSVAGSGQVGVISGEPGIGKSRSIRQFRSSLDASPRDVLSLQCSPFHVNTPLAPEIERLTRATGIQETDDAELALAKLRSLLARAVTDLGQALRYYGAVLGLAQAADPRNRRGRPVDGPDHHRTAGTRDSSLSWRANYGADHASR